MSEEQEYELDFSAEDSTEYSESNETDLDEALLHFDELMEASNVTAPAAVPPTTPAMPITSLKCVHCDRIRANERIYACKGGHLICAKCVQFPTEASFRILPHCPHCNEDAEPNANAQHQIEELTVKCQYCQADFRNFYLKDHETNVCDRRPVACKYQLGGCDWHGVAAEQAEHETACGVQYKTGEEVMQALEKTSVEQLGATLFGMNDLLKLLSQTYCDLVNIRLVKKTQSSNDPSGFYYESTVFPAANLFWYVKAKVVERPEGSPLLKYALKLTSNVRTGHEYQVFYAALGGPMQLKPLMLEHLFYARSTESSFQRLFEFDAEYKNFDAPITFRLMVSLK